MLANAVYQSSVFECAGREPRFGQQSPEAFATLCHVLQMRRLECR